MSETVAVALKRATDALLDSESDTARLDAEVLLAHALGRGRAWLFTHPEAALDAATAACFADILQQRASGVPVAYLTGVREFWSLSLQITRDVLIPRPETELLVEEALSFLAGRRGKVLDLGVGSGAISLAIASERPDLPIIGVDQSCAAVRIATFNGERLGLGNVQFMESDWYSTLDGMLFELIVANPPYIAADDRHLTGEVRYEPRQALVAMRQGLADLDKIISNATGFLSNDGCLMVEHGFDQSDSVQALFANAGFHHIETRSDLAGIPRMTRGMR